MVTKKKLLMGYFMTLLLPILLATLVAFICLQYINSFLREQDEKVAETIAFHISKELENYIQEAEQVAYVYGTNQSFFPQLNGILEKSELDYRDLQNLRSIQKNLSMTHQMRPHIFSIYCCPSGDEDSKFLVSQDGVYTVSAYFDGDFIGEAIKGKRDGLVLRKVGAGSPKTTLITFVYKAEEGTVIVNLDCNALRFDIEDYVRSRTNDLFRIEYGNELLFESDGLFSLGSDKLVATASVRDDLNFSVMLFARSTDLYASSKAMMIAVSIIILFLAFIGLVIVILFTRQKYKDYQRARNYMRKVEDDGIWAIRKTDYVSKYEEIENYVARNFTEYELKGKRLELETLRHQLSPHMVVNTLQMLNWQLMKEFKGYTEVNEVLEDLCKIFSYSLYPADVLAPLSEEIRYTNSYIDIQYRRKSKSKKLMVEWPSPCPEIMVPRVIFQPVMENSFKYAFPTEGEARIWVSYEESGKGVIFFVRDNGKGMSSEKLDEICESMTHEPETGHGIGLYNTNKRIQIMFGRYYGLAIGSVEGKGTEVSIRLPLIRKEKKD